MNSQIQLKHLKTATFSEEIRKNDSTNILISVSGYEQRSRFLLESWVEKSKNHPVLIVLGFNENKSALSREANDAFYKSLGCPPHLCSINDINALRDHLGLVIKAHSKDQSKPIHVHVDYSCMPRSWYCDLVKFLENLLRDGDEVSFWYSEGLYPESDYPTAGVSDFTIYSGRSRLNTRFRVHFFGLGFDRVRASAIYSVIDPQYLVCYYADPGVKKEYVMKVRQDNEQILKDAQLIANVPVNDFVAAFSRLCALCNEFLDVADVIFVPDGPKPLVLASSLIPDYLGKPGVLCFHVARRKSSGEPVEVKPIGDISGFSFKIAKSNAV